jgi:Ni/Fe-hydrogenase subunit HybB-like protein
MKPVKNGSGKIPYGLLCTVFFGLTVASTTPWLWIMSIDAHWYSTMFSWYTFASTFVSGMSLDGIYTLSYLKNSGQLEYVTEEHLHDVGKFMFAFSVFWTYLWFSQYMLIWYSNQPEETKYFIERIGTAEKAGPYKGIFFLNLIINFLCPLLILMKRNVKRNWTLVTFMAVLIIFGHWIDFFQMVMPGTLGDHYEMMPFEFGIAALFIGIDYVGCWTIHYKKFTGGKESSFPQRKYYSPHIKNFNKSNICFC